MDIYLNVGYGLGFGAMCAIGIISISHFFVSPEKRYTKMYASDRAQPQTEAEKSARERENQVPFMELNEVGTVVGAFGMALFGWLNFRSLYASYCDTHAGGNPEGLLAYQGVLIQVILAAIAGFALTIYGWKRLR